MTDDLRALLAQQSNLLTRAQALQCGLGPGTIEHRIGPDGRWSVALPGIYAAQTGALTTPQRWIAALLYGGESALLGGPTAGAAHGLRRVPGTQRVHLLVPHGRHRASRGFVVVRRTTRLPEPWLCDGLPFVPVARAVVDTCRLLSRADPVRALVAESVQRRKTTVRALARELEIGNSAGSRLVRAALEEVADGVRSVAEGDGRRLILQSDLPRPKWNRHLFTPAGEWVACPDAWWRKAGTVLEIDSREHHLSPADQERTMRRHERMTAHGLLVVHMRPSRLRDDPLGAIAALHRTIAVGLARAPLTLTDVPPPGWDPVRGPFAESPPPGAYPLHDPGAVTQVGA